MTGHFTSIARPYALAAFEYAMASKTLSSWEEFLNTAAVVANDPMIIRLMGSPEVDKKQLAELFCDVLTSMMDAEKKNFIFLLSEHQRFQALPAIAELFKQYRAEQEKKMTVEVTSAVPLNETQKANLIEALKKRLHVHVDLECTINPDLLGGAIIRAGDQVIDGSVRGKLNRMIEFI